MTTNNRAIDWGAIEAKATELGGRVENGVVQLPDQRASDMFLAWFNDKGNKDE